MGRATDDEQIEVGGNGRHGVDGADVDVGLGPTRGHRVGDRMGFPYIDS